MEALFLEIVHIVFRGGVRGSSIKYSKTGVEFSCVWFAASSWVVQEVVESKVKCVEMDLHWVRGRTHMALVQVVSPAPHSVCIAITVCQHSRCLD
jgi:hypothetical protein